jgi:hypothetical protein
VRGPYSHEKRQGGTVRRYKGNRVPDWLADLIGGGLVALLALGLLQAVIDRLS